MTLLLPNRKRPAKGHGNAVNPSGGRWWMPRTISRRLAAILAVPLSAVLVLLGLAVIQQVSTYQTAVRISEATRLQLAVQGLVHELQRERGLTNGLLSGERKARGQVDSQRQKTGAARVALQGVLAGSSGQAGDTVRRALVQLEGLSDVRARVDVRELASGAAFAFYTQQITSLDRLDLGLTAAADRTLLTGATALSDLSMAKEAAARERGFMNGVFARGRFTAGQYEQFAALKASRQDWLLKFSGSASTRQQQAVDAATGSAAAVEAAAFEQEAVAATDGRALTVSAPDWWRVMTKVIDGLREGQITVGGDLAARSAVLQRQALVGLGVLGVVAVLLTIGAVVVVVLAARSITRPLVRLVDEADEVSQQRLPDIVHRLQSGDESAVGPPAVQVPPGASDEIRLVVESLDRMQSVAARLAAEQALLRRNTVDALANMGRRNQNLIRRQLGLISQLEQEESEPSSLANLFQLDHLAARMRRNAESLLVLAGERRSRTRSSSLPVADAIRAATSGVENYLRVSLMRVDDGAVQSHAVSDVVHLLAELIENGLSFSPPDADLEVYGRWLEAGYLIAIVDHGVGMPEVDLAAANARLRAIDGFQVSPTRQLGHHVVAKLGHRLGATVTLATSPVTGVTARVLLPSDSVVAFMPPGATMIDPRIAPSPSLAPGPLFEEMPAPIRASSAQTWTAPAAPQALAATGPGVDDDPSFSDTASFAEAGSFGQQDVAARVDLRAEDRWASDGRGDERSADVAQPMSDAMQAVETLTRNGLPKRQRGAIYSSGSGDSAGQDAEQPAARRPAPRARVDHGADHVRSRLGALRSGVRRGEGHEQPSSTRRDAEPGFGVENPYEEES